MMSIDYGEIGQRVKAFRIKHGLSQEKLGIQIGVGPSHISHIENGHTKMSLQTLVNICNVMGISSDQLLCYDICAAKDVLNTQIAESINDCTPAELRIITDTITSLHNSLKKMR